ncbi:MAG TPA: hypothetical protein VMV05_10785 [bacterium]|nr:hypothetical protein [bacterium]
MPGRGGDPEQEPGPHWYPLSLAVISLPCAWLGGWIFERKIG